MIRKELTRNVGQVVNLGKEITKRKIKEEDEQLRKDEENLAFKNDLKEAVNAEYELRKKGKSSHSTLRDVMIGHFERDDREGVMLFPRNNRKAYTNLYLVERNSKEIIKTKYLVVAVNKIIYIDIEKDVMKTIELRVEDIDNIRISNNRADVLIEDEDSTRYIIKDNKLTDDNVANRSWKDMSLSGQKYKRVNFIIGKEKITIKVHNLYLLLKYGLAVMTTVIWSGAGLYCPDHINGDTLDNRESNLQIITQKASAAKKGSMEDHMSFDTYDYAADLKAITDEVERNKLQKSS